MRVMFWPEGRDNSEDLDVNGGNIRMGLKEIR
jgi:hypothetical protein